MAAHTQVEKDGKDKRWSITVADGDGDEATVEINANAHLEKLLREALDALYGKPRRDADEYDVLIAGVVQTDLSPTLREAGLSDGSEVVILPKDVSRG